MSRRNLYIVGGLLLVVITAAYWFVLLSPLRGEIKTVDTSITAEQQKLTAAKAELVKLSALRDQAAANQARLIELAKMMPSAKEVPSLIIQMQDLANEAGIDFMTVSPGQAAASTAYATLPLTLQFEGTFFDINDFLYRVEQMVGSPGRLLSIQQVDLSLPESTPALTSPVLKASITIDAFQFVPAAVIPGQTTPTTPGTPGQTPASTNTAGAPATTGGATTTEQG